jgi:diguanylate cyclase (GGDEF)-like protein
LSRQILFVVAYFDLDYFKAFNDEYGYRLGDDVIQLAASVLAEVINPDVDFLGHIGGDDYVVVFSSTDWEKKVQNTLKQFDLAVRPFFTAEHLAARGFITQNRQNVDVFHPLVGISAGVVVVEPGTIESPAELSHRLAETKKLAKKMSGSSYFVDRRGIR